MKKYIHFIIASILMAHCAMAQDTTYTSEYFKLIKTYNTLDEVYLAHPELKPQPPKIVINDDEVLFYNDERAIVNRMTVVKEEAIPVDDPNYGTYSENIKIHRNYKVINAELLGIWESYGYWDGIHTVPKSACVLNNTGEFITSIKKTHDVIVAPDKKHFATYYGGEGGGDTLFVYEIDGSTISNNVFLNKNYHIDFTECANYFKIRNTHKGIISIIDLFGKPIWELNYLKIIKKPLFNFFFLPNCKKVFVSTFIEPEEVFLFDMDSNLIWKSEAKRSTYCRVNKQKHTMILLTLGKFVENQNRKKYIEILTLKQGDRLDVIDCDEIIYDNNDNLILKRLEVYYVCEIK